MSDFWSDIGSGLAKVAPTLAGVLTNVVAPGMGPIAAAGVGYILDALGVDKSAPEAEQQAAVQAALASANPETLLALKKADQDFSRDMAKIGVDLERIAAGDRDSARKREMEVKDKTPAIVTYIILATFMLTVGGVTIAAVSGALNNMDPFAAGQLGSIISGVTAAVAFPLGYYFGMTNKSATEGKPIALLDRRAA